MSFIIDTLISLIGIYKYALIIYILMSWFPGIANSQIGVFLAKICEPFLEPFRRIIPPIGMMDFSPLVALIVLNYAPNGLRAIQNMFS
ncbi:MAG: YggT family protein [Bacillota bacterium]|nr:YggT family protein [Bacillota bacterium]MDP4168962.1 YggT family protein [Bacillota bacterium]